MTLAGYWVVLVDDTVTITRARFDETALDPATDWKEAWPNQERDGPAKGYVELESALACAAEYLARPQDAGGQGAGRSMADMGLPSLTLGA